MTSGDLKNIEKYGHKIGLHHSHPTLLESLSFNEQLKEYKKYKNSQKVLNNKNYKFLSTSHICVAVIMKIQQVLKQLGIKLDLKQIMNIEKEKI